MCITNFQKENEKSRLSEKIAKLSKKLQGNDFNRENQKISHLLKRVNSNSKNPNYARLGAKTRLSKDNVE